MTTARSVIKHLKFGLLIVTVSGLIMVISSQLVAVELSVLGAFESTLIRVGFVFAVVRVVVFGCVLTVGWKTLARLVQHQTGIVLDGFRYRLSAWYVAIEAVILFQLYGVM